MGKQRQANYRKEKIDNLCKENRQFQKTRNRQITGKKKQLNQGKEETAQTNFGKETNKSWERRDK